MFRMERLRKEGKVMGNVVSFAEAFMNLFRIGAETFISWMTGIVPIVLMLMVFMNTLISFMGEKRVNRIAKACTRNPVTRYMVLPFVASFMLGNPMALAIGRFLPEFYKPSFKSTMGHFLHTSSGIFPHINPGELFVWLGIAQGIEVLGFNTMDLAIRYLLVGLVMNFFAGWATDFTTAYLCKKNGVTLSKDVKVVAE